MATLKKHIKWFLFHTRQDRLDSISAHGAYFIIISAIPFILFLFALFNQLHLSETELINEILSLVPENVTDAIAPYLTNNVSNTSVFSISVVTFIWSASSGMVAIIKGFDTIYDVEETRSFIRLRLVAIVYILLMALVLIITAVTLVFGSTLYEFLLERSSPLIATLLLNFKSLFGFILLIIFFCLIFNVIPRKKAKFINNFLGAVFSAAGWVLFSYFFSIFVDNFSNFSVVYGSLATMIVMMLWLFFCMYIMFLGAEVSMWLEISDIKKDLRQLLHKQGKKLKGKFPSKKKLAAKTEKTKKDE